MKVSRLAGVLFGAIVLADNARSQTEDFFLETPPAVLIRDTDGPSRTATMYTPTLSATGGVLRPYHPSPEVSTPHSAHHLTVFHPTGIPAPPEGYPAILYSNSGSFVEFPPSTDPAQIVSAFLTDALERGWAVVSVGTVGITSIPTCAQPDTCNWLPNPCPVPGQCWDPSLWYEPDDIPGSPWNDFNYFYGEKDFVWARQWLAMNAGDPTVNINNNKVIASGTSSGAHYAAFLAYKSEPWSEGVLGFEPSEQLRQPTDIAGVAAFDPVVWLQGWPSSDADPPRLAAKGFHWPLSTNPMDAGYRERSPVIDDVGGGGAGSLEVLQSCSMSTWMRQTSRRVATLIVSGDANEAGFARDTRVIDLPPVSWTPNLARCARMSTCRDVSDGSSRPKRKRTRSAWRARRGTSRRSRATWT